MSTTYRDDFSGISYKADALPAGFWPISSETAQSLPLLWGRTNHEGQALVIRVYDETSSYAKQQGWKLLGIVVQE